MKQCELIKRLVGCLVTIKSTCMGVWHVKYNEGIYGVLLRTNGGGCGLNHYNSDCYDMMTLE